VRRTEYTRSGSKLSTGNLSYLSKTRFETQIPLFLLILLGIYFSVKSFASAYIEASRILKNFKSLFKLFLIRIIGLLTRQNAPQLFLSWEGLGITRGLLVLFYQTNERLRRALWTVLRNRIGDAVLFRILCFHFNWNTNLNLIWRLSLIFMAGSTKGALVPFRTWLTKAIAAPTPVSALVHRSTLVVAGPLLILYLIPYAIINHLKIITGLALLSIILRGVLALKEIDLKKLIALRTLSQIRLGVLLASLGGSFLGGFHLTAHALYKSLLFISVGNLIQTTWGEQEQRHATPQLSKASPVVLNISLLSLSGLFYSGGRAIKELALETNTSPISNSVACFTLIFTFCLTVRYSYKISKRSKEIKPLTLNKIRAKNMLRLLGLRVFRLLLLNWTSQNIYIRFSSVSEETYTWIALVIIMLTKKIPQAHRIERFNFYMISRIGQITKRRLNNLGVYTEQLVNFQFQNKLRGLLIIRFKILKILFNYSRIIGLILLLSIKL